MSISYSESGIIIKEKLTNYGIKVGLKEIGYEGVDWIHLSQGRVQWRVVQNKVTNLRVR
jgi:hypothetical protein